MATTLQEKKTASILYVPMWYNALKNQGVNENILPYLIAKLAYETDFFTSNVYKKNLNPGGISWNTNYLKRPGTSKGTQRPVRENDKPGVNQFYVKFDNVETAAKDYIRIINKKGRLGKPIEATDLDNFVDRLKANGYFTDSIQKYKAGLISVNKRLSTWNDYAAISKKKTSITANIGIFAVLLALGYFTKKFF